MTERKAVKVELKEAEGAFRATFATFNVVDKDGDVTLPGAFSFGQPVRVSQFAHNWGDYIIGDGKIGGDQEKAFADAEFYLETSRGLDTYRSVKRASAAGLQEWSYGFDVDKQSFGKFGDRDVRFLEKLTVHEVSPVMLGAGVGTGTDFIKGLRLADHEATVLAAVKSLSDRFAALAAENEKTGRAISAARVARIREVITSGRAAAEAISTSIASLEELLAEAGIEDDDEGKSALIALRESFLMQRSVT